MNEFAYAPVCGIYCGECQFLGQKCQGCGNIDGKPFWTTQIPSGTCPLHNCCHNVKHLEHCGLCAEFPCKTFNDLRDPNMSDDEFAESLNTRKNNLLIRKKIGTERWLKERSR